MRPVTRAIIRSPALGVLTTFGVAWTMHHVAPTANRDVEVYGRSRIPEQGEGAGILTVERTRATGKTWLKLLVTYPGPRDPKVVVDTLTPALPAWERRLCTPWRSRTWPTDKYDRAYVTAVGWPCRALWHEYLFNPALDVPPTFLFFNQHPPAHTYETPGAFRLGDLTMDFVAGVAVINVPATLPYQPIARGFAINTFLYAAAWFVILLTPGRVRRWSRSKHGRCPTCGYDVRALAPDAPCPECGEARQEK